MAQTDRQEEDLEANSKHEAERYDAPRSPHLRERSEEERVLALRLRYPDWVRESCR